MSDHNGRHNPPSPNGDNGRDARGRFAKGNAGGPGAPHARRVAQLRAAMLEAVSEEDLKAVVSAMVKAARGGDVQAARVLLDRLLGPPVPVDVEERIAELEAAIEGETHHGH